MYARGASSYRVMPRLIFISAVLFAAAGSAVAQPSGKNSDSGKIDEIVVRATRMDKRIKDIPAAVSVATRNDIQLGRQQLALDEALAFVPGTFIQSRYNFSRDLRIAIRGFGARSGFGIRGIKIIVDGIPESLPDGQGQSDGIDLGSTEQIEVIRGPSSSLYGNASGGVINITSERGPRVPFAETRLWTGDYGFRRYQLKAGGEAGRLNYLFNLSDMKYDGYRRHSETENTSLNARLIYAIDEESELGLVVNVTDQPIAFDPGGVTLEDAEADPRAPRQRNVDFDTGESLEQQRIGLTYEKSFGENHAIRLRNHYVWRDFANKLPFVGGGATQFERFFVGGGGLYAYTGEFLGRPNNLILGLDLDRQEDDRQRFDNNTGVLGPLIADQNEIVTNTGLFLQNEFTVSDALTLTVGLRYDEIKYEVEDKFLSDGDDSASRTLDEVSPMFGVVYSPFESASLYATISTAFEAPTTVELSNPSGAGGFNPDLEPQLATNYEVGIKGTLGERNGYEFALFSIDVEDELIPFEIGGRDIYENAGKSSREGVEVAFSTKPVDDLSIRLSYTYSDFKFDEFVNEDGDDFSGNTIPGVPENVLYGEVFYTHPSGFFGAIDAQNVGKIYANNANSVTTDSYTVVNLRAGLADWRLGNWALEPFIGVNNLTDEKYFAEIRINSFGGRFYEAAPDRHFYGGVAIRYNFDRKQQ